MLNWPVISIGIPLHLYRSGVAMIRYAAVSVRILYGDPKGKRVGTRMARSWEEESCILCFSSPIVHSDWRMLVIPSQRTWFCPLLVRFRSYQSWVKVKDLTKTATSRFPHPSIHLKALSTYLQSQTNRCSKSCTILIFPNIAEVRTSAGGWHYQLSKVLRCLCCLSVFVQAVEIKVPPVTEGRLWEENGYHMVRCKWYIRVFINFIMIKDNVVCFFETSKKHIPKQIRIHTEVRYTWRMQIWCREGF